MKRIGLFCCLLSLLLISSCATNNSECSHSFGAWQKVGDEYSAKVEFCVYPKAESGETEENDGQYGVHGRYGNVVMDNMMMLLNGESFAEQMMLNGRELPDKDDPENFPGVAENEALCAAITAAESWLNDLNEDKETLEDLLEARADSAKKLTKEREALEAQWAGLYNINVVNCPSFNEMEYTTTISVIDAEHADYQKVKATQDAYKLWSATRDELDWQDDEIELQQEAILPLQENTERAVEVALETWRETEQYQETLKKHKEAVSFSYTNSLSSFICVEIFVLNDKDFAEEVFEKVKTVVPEYVEKNMTVPAGYVGTSCVRVRENDELTQKDVYERICETCGFVDKK